MTPHHRLSAGHAAIARSRSERWRSIHAADRARQANAHTGPSDCGTIRACTAASERPFTHRPWNSPYSGEVSNAESICEGGVAVMVAVRECPKLAAARPAERVDAVKACVPGILVHGGDGQHAPGVRFGRDGLGDVYRLTLPEGEVAPRRRREPSCRRSCRHRGSSPAPRHVTGRLPRPASRPRSRGRPP